MIIGETKESPFDDSLMVDFRKRFPAAGIQKIAEVIALRSLQQQSVKAAEETSEGRSTNNCRILDETRL